MRIARNSITDIRRSGKPHGMRRKIGMRQKYHRRVLILVLGIGILLTGKLPSVHAAFKLQIDDAATTGLVPDVNVLDNGLGDLSPLLGVITFMGSTPSFLVNVTTGISKPSSTVNPDYEAKIHLDSINLSSTMPGTITIKLTDTDFDLIAPSPPTGVATTSMGGVMLGTIDYVATFFDPTNTEFGMGDELYKETGIGPGAFSRSSSQIVELPTTSPDRFSLTSIVTITHTQAMASSSFNLETSVTTPEPGTLLLLGTGLLGFAGYGWRRRRMQKV
jgi:hypothetical protein